MAERFTPPRRDELDEDGKDLYDQITLGPRGTSKQYFQLILDDTSLAGPFGAMLLSPEIGSGLLRVGGVLRFGGRLPPRLREAVILRVAARSAAKFEARAHGQIALDCNLAQDEIDQIAHGATDNFEPELTVLFTTVDQLFDRGTVDEECFSELLKYYDQPLIFEVIVLIGYYRLLADVMNSFEIE